MEPRADLWWPLPWVPTIQCRDGFRAAGTPTPARWGPPWAAPFFQVPTRAVVAALRNGVTWRCHCVAGRCQGKLAAIEARGWPPGWPWGPSWGPSWPGWVWPWEPGDANAWFSPRFPAVMVIRQAGEVMPPVTVTGSQVLPGSTSGMVLVDNTTAAPITLTLPPGAAPGQQVTVKDQSGTATAYPVTVVCQPNVDGDPSYELTSDFAAVTVAWLGTQWGTL